MKNSNNSTNNSVNNSVNNSKGQEVNKDNILTYGVDTKYQPKDYSFFVNRAFFITLLILAILLVVTVIKSYKLKLKLQQISKEDY
jgi:hypothetical protein